MRLKALGEKRPGWTELRALKEGRHHAVWRQFYNSPYNFAVLQQFAKWFYPEEFADMDPVTNFAEFHDRFLPISYSGGQKQIVSIAQALVREPDVLLMDEPTSSLDLQRQLEVLELIQQITAQRGIITLISQHDLNLAARYASRFVVMDKGTVYVSGSGNHVLTPEMLSDVYGVKATVLTSPDGILQVTPIGSIRTRGRVVDAHA